MKISNIQVLEPELPRLIELLIKRKVAKYCVTRKLTVQTGEAITYFDVSLETEHLETEVVHRWMQNLPPFQ